MGRRVAARVAARVIARDDMLPAEYRETVSEMSGLLHRALAARSRIVKQVQASPGAREVMRDLEELYASLVGMVEANGWTVMGTTIR